MKFEQIGEVFFDGRVVKLDNASIESLDASLEKIKIEKDNLMNKLNNILAEIQN